MKIPDGWQLVPKELDLNMVDAATTALDRSCSVTQAEIVHHVYQATLAAAPSAPFSNTHRNISQETIALAVHELRQPSGLNSISSDDIASAIFKAMLSAAPTAPAGTPK